MAAVESGKPLHEVLAVGTAILDQAPPSPSQTVKIGTLLEIIWALRFRNEIAQHAHNAARPFIVDYPTGRQTFFLDTHSFTHSQTERHHKGSDTNLLDRTAEIEPSKVS